MEFHKIVACGEGLQPPSARLVQRVKVVTFGIAQIILLKVCSHLVLRVLLLKVLGMNLDLNLDQTHIKNITPNTK